MKTTITTLKTVPVREAFPNEAKDLTPWLGEKENIEALGERIGLQLSVKRTEVPVGRFKLDLLCQDAEGNEVVVENQLEETDHDHLGKVLTYLAGRGAKTAIWITSKPLDEHKKVISWLNRTTGGDFSFYLVKVEATKISASQYLAIFTPLIGPDLPTKADGGVQKSPAKGQFDRVEFWRGLFSNPVLQDTAYSRMKARSAASIGAPTEIKDVHWETWIQPNGAWVYLTWRLKNEKTDQAFFEAIDGRRASLEKEFGEPLNSERRRGGKWAWIGRYFKRDLRQRDAWPALQAEMADAMARFEKVFGPKLKEIYESLK